MATTTLMNERVAIGGGVAARSSGPIHEALRIWKDKADKTAAQRDRLMALWVEAEVARLTNMRARALRTAGTPGPEGSVAKLVGAELNKRVYELCVDLLGMTGTLFPTHYEMRRPDRAVFSGGADPRHTFLRSPGQLHRGRHLGDHAQHPGRARARAPRASPALDKDMAWSEVPRS